LFLRCPIAVGGQEALETAVRDYTKAKELLIAEARASGGGASPDREILKDLEKNLREAKSALKKAKRKDYYKILDVAKDADEDALRKAYRKMALKYHPDKNACADEKEKLKAEAMFKDVGEAYAILNDPTKRRQYDMGATFNASGDIDITADDDDDGHPGMRGFHGGGHGGMGGVRMGGMGGGGGIPM
jgi:DnaJ homolog subfamily C member 7